MEAIQTTYKQKEQLDEVTWNGESYLLFKQKNFGQLKLHPDYDILSSLLALSNEVKTWRHIGIGFAVSFFALTLALLTFGSNIFNQLTREAAELRTQLRIRDAGEARTQQSLKTLSDKVTVLGQQLDNE